MASSAEYIFRTTGCGTLKNMNLLHLAPDIQEAILFLPRVETGKDPVTERELRGDCGGGGVGRERRMWSQTRVDLQAMAEK